MRWTPTTPRLTIPNNGLEFIVGISMFRNVISVASCLTVLLTSSIPAAALSDGKTGVIYYRYKDVMPGDPSNPGPVSKDVMAYYIGGVGIPFSEILPLKPEWEDDSWRVVGGNLPDGVTFNTATRTFEGTPTTAVSGLTVDLEGFDTENRSVATARATFDIEVISGVPVKTDIYAHTGKYRLTELAVPTGVTVDTWQVVSAYPAPPGVTFAGSYMEGYPARAGTWNYMVLGRNYRGEVVATFYGNYIVENGPVFPQIADSVYDLPYPYSTNQLEFDFGPAKVQRSVGAPSQVKYYLEIDPSSSLPGNVTSNYDSSALRLHGTVSQPYDTAKIRWKAIDVDDTYGWSNWFTFGSRDPNPICVDNGPPPKLFFSTDKDYSTKIGTVAGGKGAISYAYKSGTLPNGLTFDAPSGRIVGRPKTPKAASIFRIDVNVTNGSNVVTETCAYEVSAINGAFSVLDATDEQAKHVRVGKPYNGVLSIKGGLTDFDTSFTDPSAWPDYSFSTTTKNTASVGITGVPAAAGTFSLPFTSTNGDGNVVQRNATVYAHPELSVGAMGDVHVKRLAASQVWATVPVDASSVIPDTKKGGQPKFSVANITGLPSDVVLSSAGQFTGMTAADVGSYGPFAVTVSDFTGDAKTTSSFRVIVDPRDEIAVGKLTPPVFTVEWDVMQTATPVTPKQPTGAADFRVDYKLNNLGGGPDPDWLHFDPKTGQMSADTGIPFSSIGDLGPFTVTMTDEDGSSVTSDPFNITLSDWPNPSATMPGKYRGTVSGDTAVGETATFVTIPSVLSAIDPKTVIGGLGQVTFVSSDPDRPAGLYFNAADGSFSGVPTGEFNGPVTVTFKDGKGREGTVSVPLQVKAYPKVTTAKSSYDLSRLADAGKATIIGVAGVGFWNQPTWSIDTAKGSDIASFGLSVDPLTGAIGGSTDAAVDTVISNIVLKASSKGANGEHLESWTAPFSIRVVEPSSIKLSYAPDTVTYFMSRNQAGGYDLVNRTPAVPSVAGSYVAPLAYSADLSPAIAEGFPATLTFDSASGQFIGVPNGLGTWSIPVTVSDSEGRASEGAPTTLNVKATLAGNVETSNGGGGSTLTLRQEEPFQRDALLLSNEIRPVVFSATPAAMPATVAAGFDPQTGAFSDQSYFPAPNASYKVSISVKDAQGREFKNPVDTTFHIVAPLTLSVSPASLAIASKQYSAADPIDVSFSPLIGNRIGSIRYSIDGTLPGIEVNRIYDDNGLVTGYVWADSDHSYEIALNSGGTVTGYKVDGIPHQIENETAPDGTVQPLPADSYFPPDALVFDTMLATLNGIPSLSGEFKIKIVATDSHAKDYIRDVPTRTAYNTAKSQTASISVASAEPFSLSADVPFVLTVNKLAEPMAVTAINAAFGKTSGWTISGTPNLPPGIDCTTVDGQVKCTGTPTALGKYQGVTVGAHDYFGAPASISLAFEVVNPSGPIELATTDIVTRPGIPFSMQAVSGNTYGKVQYYSNDIDGDPKTHVPGQYVSDLDIGIGTGLVTGAFPTIGDRTFDVYVTDATNRVTSKPVSVSVIPDLRPTVPDVVQATQGIALTRTTDTAYNIGTVSYAKGTGNWPDGVTVDPKTGTILGYDTSTGTAVNRVLTAPGSYPDLTIKATDTFTVSGVQYTQSRNSNTFALEIAATTAVPDIANPAKTILGTQGTTITPWTPSVVEKGTSKKWVYGGTVYSTNYDLSQYGLTFDTATGVVSGKPTKPFIIRDFKITVTTARGDTDTTIPFWIGVAPSMPLTLDTAKTRTYYEYRNKTIHTTDPIVMVPASFLGTLTATKVTATNFALDATTGVFTFDFVNNTVTLDSVISRTIRITDEFNRTLDIVIQYKALAQLVAGPPSVPVKQFAQDFNYGPTNESSVTSGKYGTITYDVTGLPDGMTFNPSTGGISGAPTAASGTFAINVIATDSYDNAKASTNYTISLVGRSAQYWRFRADSVIVHSSGDMLCLSELRWKSGTSDAGGGNFLFSDSIHEKGTSISQLVNGVTSETYANTFCTGGTVGTAANGQKHWIAIGLATPTDIDQVVISARGDGSSATHPSAWTISRSDDNGKTWTNVWTGSKAGNWSAGQTVSSKKP